MKSPITIHVLNCIAFFVFFCSISQAQPASIRIPVTDFNPENIDKQELESPKWSTLTFPRRAATHYSLLLEDSVYSIKAESSNSASGLVYKVDIDPSDFPIIEWKWRVDAPVKDGNVKSKKGDDYAARIYITFDYDKKKLSFGDRLVYETLKTFTRFPIPLRAINYIWANNAEIGTITPNAYSDWVYMIVAASGDEFAGNWISHSQNILEDYRKAFGEDPPRISGIAIMTDTDDTNNSATAYYGDIIFRKAY